MAKTASLNATNRSVSRYTEGESAPALPPGARAIASQDTQRITEDTPAAPPGNNEIYAAYTLIRENLHINDPGRTR
jgi:hypothetical protein